MCRFIAYLGDPLLIDDVLFKPKNSLVKQSIHAREIDEPLNGDGFGLGWYIHAIDKLPGLFRSIQPAWNDLNLQALAKKISTDCFFGHVRAASSGGINFYNCHPFQYNQFLFMHNGEIGNFQKLKRFIRRKLSDDIYDWISGQTDSEHFFALFLELFNKKKLPFNAENVATTLKQTLELLHDISKQHGEVEPSYINAAITDGKSLVAIRFNTDPETKPLSLYYATGSKYEYRDGACYMHPAGANGTEAVLVVSEKLDSHRAEWHEVPVNNMLLVHTDLSTTIRPIG